MSQTLANELAQTYRQIEALVMLTKCLPLRHPLPPMRGSSVSPDLALLLDAGVGRIERRLMRWQPAAGETEKL